MRQPTSLPLDVQTNVHRPHRLDADRFAGVEDEDRDNADHLSSEVMDDLPDLRPDEDDGSRQLDHHRTKELMVECLQRGRERSPHRIRRRGRGRGEEEEEVSKSGMEMDEDEDEDEEKPMQRREERSVFVGSTWLLLVILIVMLLLLLRWDSSAQFVLILWRDLIGR